MSTQPNTTHKYMLVAKMLIKNIQSGQLVDGERLPPERVMATEMEISVTTLRKALRLLEDDGMLIRRQGSGNYVNARGDPQNRYALFRIEKLSGPGHPKSQLLDVERLRKSDHQLPNFGTSDHAFRIRRLRSLDDMVCVLEEIWLDGDSATNITADTVTESLYQFYRESLGIWIRRVEDRISVSPLPDWCPAELACEPGQIMGFVERFAWGNGQEPIEFSRNWFDPETSRYVARLS